MSDSVRPHRRQPTRLRRPWDSPGKNTGVDCRFFLQCIIEKSENEVAQSCPTLATPWTAAYQAPPSMGFSRQKYWSGVPSSSPYDPTDVGNLISDSSAFPKASLNIWKFMVHMLKPGFENLEHYFTNMWNECNFTIVWAFFGIAFLWDWNENWHFPVLWPLLSFPNLLAYLMQHHLLGF